MPERFYMQNISDFDHLSPFILHCFVFYYPYTEQQDKKSFPFIVHLCKIELNTL